uniref:Uncharacterized protein n=1 Tax=Molossus molossus TaxID=27622 RepID=A0A7J8HC72_MOLMO|nr:hypothetical protein HJG59_011105 [Molossus molossus]
MFQGHSSSRGTHGLAGESGFSPGGSSLSLANIPSSDQVLAYNTRNGNRATSAEPSRGFRGARSLGVDVTQPLSQERRGCLTRLQEAVQQPPRLLTKAAHSNHRAFSVPTAGLSPRLRFSRRGETAEVRLNSSPSGSKAQWMWRAEDASSPADGVPMVASTAAREPRCEIVTGFTELEIRMGPASATLCPALSTNVLAFVQSSLHGSVS